MLLHQVKSGAGTGRPPRIPCHVLVVALVFWAAQVSFAAEKTPPAGGILQSESPVRIASDRMDVDQVNRTILFQGHVVVQQDDLTITGKTLRVFAARETGAPSGGDTGMMERIDRIEVEGDVKISQQDKVAVAERAVYYHQEQKIVLMGNPSVSQGQDRVEGRLITLFLEQGRSVVEGSGDSPVKAVLNPKRKE